MNQNKKIVNFDKEKPVVCKDCVSFGFSEGADIVATDINIDENGSNFKINYKGNSVPFWAKGAVSSEAIYDILERIAKAVAMGKNLVEISKDIKKDLQK